MTQKRPEIIVTFADDECQFVSVFWGNNARLMEKARDAIRRGDNRDEVLANLNAAGFYIIEEKIQ